MQRLEVSGAVRLIYRSLGVKGLRNSHPECSVEGRVRMRRQMLWPLSAFR